MEIKETYGNIYLVEKKEGNTAQELKETFPGRKICACDFYITESEKGKLAESKAMNFQDLLIIDHHAALPEMMGHVSSTTFAIQYVREHGPLDENFAIVINHTDTDALLSALIMAGELEPQDEFNAAAIAADHTGAENLISDVLQALEDDMCVQKSVDVLMKILQKRVWERKALKASDERGEFKMEGGIAYAIHQKIDSGLLPWLFPEADAIIVARVMQNGRWGIKTRLGVKTVGVALNNMGLPNTGGRWNAASTTRHGGTDTSPEEYVKLVQAGIEAVRKNGSNPRSQG